MENSQRESSPDTDQIETRLAKAISIQEEYAKRRQVNKSAFNNRQDALRNNIQRLQEELRDAENEYKEIEDEYIASEKMEKQMYRKELENYIKMPPLLLEERDEKEPQELAREQMKPTRCRHQINNAEAQIEDEIIVIDSESDDSSTDHMIDQQLVAQADTPPGQRVNTSDRSHLDNETHTEQEESPRRLVRKVDAFESDENSDIPIAKRPRHERQDNAPNKKLRFKLLGRNKKDTKTAPAFKGIINPTVGDIYKIEIGPIKAGYAAVILPTGDFGEIGISRSIHDTRLAKSIPACYRYDEQTMEILGWKKEYEDGGPRVTSRAFPVMFTDEIARIPLYGEFTALNARFDWVYAKSIRSLPLNEYSSRSTAGYQKAKTFSDRLRLWRESREIEDQRIRCDNGSPGVTDATANEMMQQIRAASFTPCRGESPHQTSMDTTHEASERPAPHTSGPQQNQRQTPEASWNIRTLKSINQETTASDATMDGYDHSLPSIQEQMLQLNEMDGSKEATINVRKTESPNDDAVCASTRESPDASDGPEAPTPQPTSHTEGASSSSVEATRYGLQGQSGFESRRLETLRMVEEARRLHAPSSRSTPAVHTNLNGGGPDNSTRVATTSSTTRTMTEEQMQSPRTIPETRDITGPNVESTTAPGSNARDTASGVLSFLNYHYNIQS
ncbi:hypothetical protein K449DRAFT_438919 [Hypoxylon sp. EC38]|nr:hypothetical protein K449DRAFT_438919 [Hypoxylon sp. EC38]